MKRFETCASFLELTVPRPEKKTFSSHKTLNTGKIKPKPAFNCGDIYKKKFEGKQINQLLDIMKSGKITNIIPSKKTGRTVKFTIYVKSNNTEIRTFFKPYHFRLNYTNPRGEVAAFILSELLEINTVPPAVLRKLSSSELLKLLKKFGPQNKVKQFENEVMKGKDLVTGAMIYWIRNVRLFENSKKYLKYIISTKPVPDKKKHIARQIAAVAMLDYLTGNYDRFSGGNILISKNKSKKLFFIDNGAAFGKQRNWKNDYFVRKLDSIKHFSRKTFINLQKTTPGILKSCFKNILNNQEIKALIKRRKLLLNRIENLIRQGKKPLF